MSMKTVLDQIVVTIGEGKSGWDESYLGEGEVAGLAAAVGPTFLKLAERWFTQLKSDGGNPHDAISGSHAGVLALQSTLIAWSKGLDPDETADQVRILKHQFDIVAAGIISGELKAAETNIVAIRERLIGFGVDPGPIPTGPAQPVKPPAPPAWDPTWEEAVEYVVMAKIPQEDGFPGGDIKALARFLRARRSGGFPGIG